MIPSAERKRAARFGEDGFAVLQRFLGARELRGLGAEVDSLLTAPLPVGCERPHNTLAPLRWNDRIVKQVVSSKRRQTALAEAIGAADLRWISAYISVKERQSPALWWHQDWWCWDHPISYRRGSAQVAVLCYLTDTTASSGALRLIPGTHWHSIGLHASLPEAHSHISGLGPNHVAMRDHPDQLTLELQAGDAVVLDYRLLHSTHANRSNRRRDCLLLNFAPAWRALPPEIRAHLIRHPALPAEGEQPDSLPWPVKLLPGFNGIPRDLTLNRAAPAKFAMFA